MIVVYFFAVVGVLATLLAVFILTNYKKLAAMGIKQVDKLIDKGEWENIKNDNYWNPDDNQN